MTKTQIWTSAFLAVFIVLFFLQRITKTESNSNADLTSAYVEPASDEKPEAALLMKNFGCVTCHGQNYQGTKVGPQLFGLKEIYSRDELINYLRNPSSYMEKDRFKAYKEKYKNIIMPPFNNKDVKDLGKIADYILTLEMKKN